MGWILLLGARAVQAWPARQDVIRQEHRIKQDRQGKRNIDKIVLCTRIDSPRGSLIKKSPLPGFASHPADYHRGKGTLDLRHLRLKKLQGRRRTPSGSVRDINPDRASGAAKNAEAQIIVAIAWTIVVPIGGTQVAFAIVPAPTAFNAIVARGRAHTPHPA